MSERTAKDLDVGETTSFWLKSENYYPSFFGIVRKRVEHQKGNPSIIVELLNAHDKSKTGNLLGIGGGTKVKPKD